jgi:hypothetical protein
MELVYRLLGHSVHGRARLGRFDLLWIEVSVFHRAVFFFCGNKTTTINY